MSDSKRTEAQLLEATRAVLDRVYSLLPGGEELARCPFCRGQVRALELCQACGGCLACCNASRPDDFEDERCQCCSRPAVALVDRENGGAWTLSAFCGRCLNHHLPVLLARAGRGLVEVRSCR